MLKLDQQKARIKRSSLDGDWDWVVAVVVGAGAAGVVDAVVDGGGKFEFSLHNLLFTKQIFE